MSETPPSIARAQKKLASKMQDGSVVSWTLLTHPPAQFGAGPRTIGLILLDDGTQVLAPLLTGSPRIGQRVRPRMRLSMLTPDRLRVYDVAYEELAGIEESLRPHLSTASRRFPGYILALTGPSGVGKSTVSRLLHRALRDHAEPVPILTTRSPKEGDEGEYRYVSPAEFQTMREARQIIAATHIPSKAEERWYGYRAADIEAIWSAGKLPIVITEMHLLQGLSDHYGRRSILSCGLLPPGRSRRAMLSHLLHRLRNRGRDTEEHIHDRIKNAEEDLRFFTDRADLFDHMLVNDDLSSIVSHFRNILARSPNA